MPDEMSAQKAAALARETPYTVEEWQRALDALGDRADRLLPTVEAAAARQGITPLAAVQMLLEAVPDA